MNTRDVCIKLDEMRKNISVMRNNKEAFERLESDDYKLPVHNNYEFFNLNPEQTVTVNQLIANFLRQNNSKMEQELKPLADLLGVEEKPDNN